MAQHSIVDELCHVGDFMSACLPGAKTSAVNGGNILIYWHKYPVNHAVDAEPIDKGVSL